MPTPSEELAPPANIEEVAEKDADQAEDDACSVARRFDEKSVTVDANGSTIRVPHMLSCAENE